VSKPGKLNDILGDFETTPDNPHLDWDQSGPVIQGALQEKNRRRRRLLIWWFSGLSVSLIAVFAFFQTREAPTINYTPAHADSEISYSNTTPNSQELNQANSFPTHTNRIEEKSSLLSSGQRSGIETKIETNNREKLIENKIEPQQYSSDQNWTDLAPTVEPRTKVNNYRSMKLKPQHNTGLVSKQEDIDAENRGFRSLKATSKMEPLDSLATIPFLAISIFDLPKENITTPTTINAEKQKSTSTKKIYLLAGLGTHNLTSVLDFSKDPYSSAVEMGMVFMPFQNRVLSNLELSAGIQYSSNRITTSFTSSRAVQLYRPGTVDTILSYSAGGETRTTRDSVPGIAIRTFRNTASLNQWSVPFHVGYGFSAGLVRLTPEAGIMPTLIQHRSGRISDANFLVTDIRQNASIDVQLAYRLGLRLEVPVGKGAMLVRYVFSHTPRFQVSSEITHSMNQQVLQLGFQYPF